MAKQKEIAKPYFEARPDYQHALGEFTSMATNLYSRVGTFVDMFLKDADGYVVSVPTKALELIKEDVERFRKAAYGDD